MTVEDRHGHDLAARLDRLAAESTFSGTLRVDAGGEVLTRAYGLAHRAHRVPITEGTRIAIASGSKGLTALAVMRLVEDGLIGLGTTARAVLGPDLPMIDAAVTIEHLLAHRSGIGDYLDEELDRPLTDYLMPVPVHELATTTGFLPALDGHPQQFPPGARFAYCNGGYVVLALIAERVTGTAFHDLVDESVCRPAGMADTAFLRSDELPHDAAVGYLAAGGLRSNVLHLPVRGNGDGGVYTTARDVLALWEALAAGRIVGPETASDMTRARTTDAAPAMGYGLGFWLGSGSDAVILEGCDAGASFRSVHRPERGLTYTVLSNTTDGAWPLCRLLDDAFGP